MAAAENLGDTPGCLDMNGLDPNVILDISRTVAAIDERTKASEKQADHRHSNVMQAIQNFVPRREIEAENLRLKEYAEQLAKESRDHCDMNREAVLARVGVIENSVNEFKDVAKNFNKWLYGVLGTGVVALLTYIATHFFHLKLFWQ